MLQKNKNGKDKALFTNAIVGVASTVCPGNGYGPHYRFRFFKLPSKVIQNTVSM